MVTSKDYEDYYKQTASSNLSRLEFISSNTLKSIMTKPVPKEN